MAGATVTAEVASLLSHFRSDWKIDCFLCQKVPTWQIDAWNVESEEVRSVWIRQLGHEHRKANFIDTLASNSIKWSQSLGMDRRLGLTNPKQLFPSSSGEHFKTESKELRHFLS